MPGEPFPEVSFYVVAHADDWQLFMQPNACHDILTMTGKVVFIVTTAGDAGAGEAYWSAREEGMKSSIRLCLASQVAVSERSGSREYNNHILSYWLANNTSCYFLRLPDGNLDGSGFSAYDHQSLLAFKTGEISTITAIDGSSAYESWADFCNTLQAIIIAESHGSPLVCLNYLNPDSAENPGDHIDHIITGQAIRHMTIISGLRQVLYVGYNVCNTQQNLASSDLFWKAGMFAAYEKAVYDKSNYSTLQESVLTYLRWCSSGPDFITINPLTSPDSHRMGDGTLDIEVDFYGVSLAK